MKQLVMIRVLGKDTYKKVVEIDFTTFQFKHRLGKEVIGTIDDVRVAMCVEDYDAALKEQREHSLTEMIRLDQELGLYNIEE
jgi:predicted RecB family endonuclease